jgi:alcohol dehydrogenase (cytochrome c)
MIRLSVLVLPLLLLTWEMPAQTTAAGQQSFGKRCAFCHGADGRGGERGPDITSRNLATRTDLAEVIRNGIPARNMPPTKIDDKELGELIAYTKSLRPAGPGGAPRIEIVANGPSFDQVAKPKAGDWPTYHGLLSGNRHSPLREITAGNVHKLAPKWIFSIPGAGRLQVTPVVYDGIMYITAPNEAYALDAATGKQIWAFRRPRTRGLAGDAAAGINRGVAILDHRLFLVTDHAHLLALDRRDGRLLWDTEMADYRQNYGSTSAPLVAGNMVIAGVSGGDEGIRGFLSAYHVDTGKEAWRFWTVPAPGDPLAETWRGKDIEHGCAATWLTGTYDASLDLLYWTTGNPCKDYNGDDRQGDNLYAGSVLALEPASGKLRWYFQYTPHDLWDWDAQQTAMLVDAQWQGKPRKLLAQASRNGFYYVLDRTDGTFLHGVPFVKNLTWATGLDAKGRPMKVAGSEPTPQGTRVCPAVEGATNWMSTAYHSGLNLFYVMALEKCNVFTKAEDTWKAGESYYGGTARRVPNEPGKKYVRALDLQTGKLKWELPLDGPGNTWGGILSTAGNVVFFGDDNGELSAVDAATGRRLWGFPCNQGWKSSPMTYSVRGKQYVAAATGPTIVSFGL